MHTHDWYVIKNAYERGAAVYTEEDCDPAAAQQSERRPTLQTHADSGSAENTTTPVVVIELTRLL